MADELRRIDVYLKRGGRYVNYLYQMVQHENERNERTAGSKIMDAIGINTYVLLFLLPAAGALSVVLGTTVARNQTKFSAWERDGHTYILVGAHNGGVVLSAVVNNSPKPSHLSDPPEIIWLSNEELSGLPLRSVAFVEGVQSKAPAE